MDRGGPRRPQAQPGVPRPPRGHGGYKAASGYRAGKLFEQEGHRVGQSHQQGLSTSTFLSSATGSGGLYSRLLADPDQGLSADDGPGSRVLQSSHSGSSRPIGASGDAGGSKHLPAAILFPANKPSSRADAAILDQWIGEALLGYAKRAGKTKEDLAEAVEELVPILSIGLHEIVRQVTHHCVERGVVLEKIWRTYVELFDRVLKEMKASLRLHKGRTQRVQEDLDLANTELEELRRKHPQQMHKLTQTLEGKFTQRQVELEDQLKYRESENLALSQHLAEQRADVRSWFPLFERYANSTYKQLLTERAPQNSAGTGTSPELAIAADFKRIMTVLPEDKRKQTGFFICSLLGLRGGKGDREREAAMQLLLEKKMENERTIARLEATLKELQDSQATKRPSIVTG